MCIVIDINTLSSVFSAESADHKEFRPVFDWINKGEGLIVYGGSKYKEELSRSSRYLRLFNEYRNARKVCEIDKKEVDKRSRIIERLTGVQCDDYHLIAIFCVSGCQLFCSKDRRADKYIGDHALYPKKHTLPKIYRNRRHRHLLCPSNVVRLRSVEKM